MALDTYALTTLANANYYLGLTTDGGVVDAYVETLINRASDIIENSIFRKIMIRVHVKERHDGKGQERMYFKQYPVLAVNLDNLVWDATAKTLTRDDGGSFVKDGFADGNKVLVQNSDSNSGLLTIDGVVTADVITFSDTITTDTDDDNVIISRFRELWIEDDLIDADDYEIAEDHIYYINGFPEGHLNIRFTYYAGYVTVPDDIEDKCLEIIKLLYSKEKGIKSEKIGPYSVTYFDSKEKIINYIQDSLSCYMNQGV